MMTSKICTQRKKSSGKFSLPNCLPLTSGKAARGSVQGETDSREIQEPSQTKKNVFVWKNRWIISIWDWSTHGLPTNEKDLLDYFCSAGTAKGLLRPCCIFHFSRLLLVPGIALLGSAGSPVPGSPGKLWSCSSLQAGTFHFQIVHTGTRAAPAATTHPFNKLSCEIGSFPFSLPRPLMQFQSLGCLICL